MASVSSPCWTLGLEGRDWVPQHPVCCLVTPTCEDTRVTGGAGQEEHRPDHSLQTQFQPLPMGLSGRWHFHPVPRRFLVGSDMGLARLFSSHSARRRLRRIQLMCSGPSSTSELQACLVAVQGWLLAPPLQAATPTPPAKSKPRHGSWEALRFASVCLGLGF